MNLEKVAMKNGEVAAQTAQKIEYYGGERYAPDVMRSTIWHVQCAYVLMKYALRTRFLRHHLAAWR